jgi:hypothetical protein
MNFYEMRGSEARRIASGREIVAGVSVGATRGGRVDWLRNRTAIDRRPYEEKSGWARFGVDDLDFEGRIQIRKRGMS